MPFPVYDYRTDITNVLVTPEIRARLYRMKPGQVDARHSHDLGVEVFLILEGKAEFTIEGHTEVLIPGQVCMALSKEVHQVRNLLPDQPTVMYLSVTPHIQPTHTGWTEEGRKEPPRFQPSSTYDVPPDRSTPTLMLLEEYVEAVEALDETTEAACDVQREQVAAFRQALAAGDQDAALQARDAMWEALYPMFKGMYALAGVWNALTYRTAEGDF
jgi:quercetin dioxygenase-like cupin family protein